MNTIDKMNIRLYKDKTVVNDYANQESLQPAESLIFEQLNEKIKDKAILDIGVGGGRTTEYLTNISNNYIGIDYSEKMIEACKQKYPNANLLCCDARDMSLFNDEQFDFILFSFNGIDCVSHTDRIKILNEIFRILKKGGYFVFSAHNRYCFDSSCLRHPINYTLNPLKLLFKISNYLQGAYNFFKIKNQEVHTSEYSIIGDPAYNYKLMIYTITIDEQKKQLEKIGFNSLIKAYDLDGKVIDNDTQNPWIHYCVRK